LIDVFLRGPKIPFANDTSFGVGYAPFSDTERVVLETEKMLNSPEYKAKCPCVGEDIKVMGLRDGNTIILTVAIAFVSKYVANIAEYIGLKEKIEQDIVSNAKKLTEREVSVSVNTGDDLKTGSVYITLTGLSCEMGDDGSVGRGNRVNGLITPMRPMSLEAAAGKNPVNHVGKIYNVLAFEMARDIVKMYPQVKECNVTLLSQIGKPIDQPRSAGVEIIAESDHDLENVKSKVAYIVDGWLEDITSITNMIVNKEVTVY